MCRRAHRRHGVRPGRLVAGAPAGAAASRASPSSTRTRSRSAASVTTSPGRTVTRRRFDRDTLIEAGRRAGRRLRRGQQRRQLQHHRRPRGARDVRRAEGGRPHLRPEARRGLRAARHPDRRHRAVDGQSAAQERAGRDRPRRRGATRPARSRCCRSRRTRAGSGTRSPSSRRRRGSRVGARHPLRRGSAADAATLIQAGDTLHVLDHRRRATRVSCATSPARRPGRGARR